MLKFFIPVLFYISLSAASLGETLFNGNCVTCHEIHTTNSAPSIKEVKVRYHKAFDSKEKFVTFMVEWITKPDAKTALMPEAIKKHGLMPLLGYDKESLTEIATFLYEHPF